MRSGSYLYHIEQFLSTLTPKHEIQCVSSSLVFEERHISQFVSCLSVKAPLFT